MKKVKEEIKLKLFDNENSFEFAQRVAKALCSSDIVPKQYKDNIPNTLIALEMARRLDISPLMVMQHLNIIQGKPSWSSTFLISAINNCGKYEGGLRFIFTGEKNTDTWGCVALAKIKGTDEIARGTEATIGIAKSEGWFSKPGSKWKTIPELMLQYRAAAFFSRVYCPEITMGMQSEEEIRDTDNNISNAVQIEETGQIIEAIE